jgi:hypothetical protein
MDSAIAKHNAWLDHKAQQRNLIKELATMLGTEPARYMEASCTTQLANLNQPRVEIRAEAETASISLYGMSADKVKDLINWLQAQ